jgi:hypothetical protein
MPPERELSEDFNEDVAQVRMPSQYRRLEGRQAPTTWRHGEAAMLVFIGPWRVFAFLRIF